MPKLKHSRQKLRLLPKREKKPSRHKKIFKYKWSKLPLLRRQMQKERQKKMQQRENLKMPELR
jgi:hypothetical protein